MSSFDVNISQKMDVLSSFEVSGIWRAKTKIKDGIKLNETPNGVEFETDEVNSDEEDNFDDNPVWWSQDGLLDYLNNETVEQEGNPTHTVGDEFSKIVEQMTPLTEDKGVCKRVLRHGTGDLINEKSSVSYHCEAYLDGVMEPFDSSILRGRPFLSRLNVDLMVPGLFIGLKSMRMFERSEFMVQPEYAFGDIGCHPRIPPKAVILYRVEILKIFAEGSLAHFEALTSDEKAQLSFEDVLKMCEEEKVSGNSYYRTKKWKEAAFRYRKAIQVLEPYIYSKNPEEVRRTRQILLPLYTNASNVYNKLEKHKTAANFCDRALRLEPDNVKAMFHKAVAFIGLDQNENAKSLLLEAHSRSNDDKQTEDITLQLKKLETKMKRDMESENELYIRMSKAIAKPKV